MAITSFRWDRDRFRRRYSPFHELLRANYCFRVRTKAITVSTSWGGRRCRNPDSSTSTGGITLLPFVMISLNSASDLLCTSPELSLGIVVLKNLSAFLSPLPSGP